MFVGDFIADIATTTPKGNQQMTKVRKLKKLQRIKEKFELYAMFGLKFGFFISFFALIMISMWTKNAKTNGMMKNIDGYPEIFD